MIRDSSVSGLNLLSHPAFKLVTSERVNQVDDPLFGDLSNLVNFWQVVEYDCMVPTPVKQVSCS